MKKKLLTTAILITGLISAKNYHYTIKISDTSLFSNTNTIEYNQEKNLLLNIIETPHIPSIVKSIYADEQYIYLALSNYSGNKLQIMRKSDWSIINNIPIVNNSLNKIFVDKHYIYIGYNGGGNISVFKKSDFETTNLPPTSWLGEVYSISSDDGHLYIGHRDYNYFSIINKSNWNLLYETPVLPGRVMSIANDENFVYLGHNNGNGFSIIRKSDWSLVSGTPFIDNSVSSVFVDNNFIYLTHSQSLSILNKNDLNLLFREEYPVAAITEVHSDQNYIYLSQLNNKNFTVIKKSDWSVVQNTPVFGNWSWSVFSDGSFVYLGGGNSKNLNIMEKIEY